MAGRDDAYQEADDLYFDLWHALWRIAQEASSAMRHPGDDYITFDDIKDTADAARSIVETHEVALRAALLASPSVLDHLNNEGAPK